MSPPLDQNAGVGIATVKKVRHPAEGRTSSRASGHALRPAVPQPKASATGSPRCFLFGERCHQRKASFLGRETASGAQGKGISLWQQGSGGANERRCCLSRAAHLVRLELVLLLLRGQRHDLIKHTQTRGDQRHRVGGQSMFAAKPTRHHLRRTL